MRVLCIKDEWTCEGEDMPGPKYGDVCTVTGVYNDCDGDYYYLLEYSIYDVYNAVGFITCSTIDETEMIREYKTEPVCV